MLKRRTSMRLIFGIIGSIILIFVFKIYLDFEYNLKRYTIDSLNYSQGNILLQYFTRINSWFYDLFHFNEIRNQAHYLNLVNDQLSQKLLELNNAIQENETLKTALRLKEEKKWYLVPAQVLLVDPSGLTGNIWINKGIKNGINKGMNVILDNQSLVGITTECYDYYCRVETILSPKIKISVKDINNNTIAMVERDIKGRFLMKLVPHEANVQPEDILITSNENKQYIQGLLIGKVKQLISEEMSLKEYLLEPLFTPDQLTNVLIITNFVIPNE